MNNEITATPRAAIYERVSTEEQVSGYGLDVQDNACRAYVEAKGWTLVGVYPDEGVSGSLTSRPAFDRLMEEVKAGRVDVVVVHKFDRVGRTGRAFWRWVWQLEDMETGLVSVTQEIDTTTNGKLMLQQFAAFAEFEYNLIRERTQAGLQIKATQGGWTGGQPPYGWRIEGKGMRGSRLVVDPDERRVLRQIWTMLVQDRLTLRQTAARLNATGTYTRMGRPWSHQNLRNKLKSDAVMNARVVFRNPDRAHTGHGARLKRDGTPLYGAPVTIPLEPIFTPEEVSALRHALGLRYQIQTRDRSRSYPLSKRVFGLCGAYYTGLNKHGRDGRWYRCTGRNERYVGADVCSCDVVDADTLEAAVWAEVIQLLGDPDRLKAMAAEWVGLSMDGHVNYAARVADLDRQIAERQQAMTTTITEYAKAGLPVVAVEAATRALVEEVEQLQAMRAEAEAWQAESETAAARARDLEELAGVARARLHDMAPAEKAEVLALLDVRVTITGPVPRPRLGKPCTLAQWFRSAERPVPGVLTDEQWSAIEPIVKEWEPPNHRLVPGRAVVDAILTKARTGCRWQDLKTVGSGKTAHRRFSLWLEDGRWERIMALLPREGTPLPGTSRLPSLRIEGRVDPRMMSSDEAGSGERVSARPSRRVRRPRPDVPWTRPRCARRPRPRPFRG
ncbi:transposase [Streptomyces alkaliphilus]|uniref:Transposase n=1 Tax=Streptomyces alkaliphilus TaxID=1472722 RepID=A0A7W3T9Z0_9ACTN|nr:recombinase family protein [Streptomyces alkaliphilus]MBB0243003.1 transposase [Streptomyces alkaliphilus]